MRIDSFPAALISVEMLHTAIVETIVGAAVVAVVDDVARFSQNESSTIGATRVDVFQTARYNYVF